ncbi:ABC transporter ATP-binding protein [Streptomyces siamensis]|uniref:ABC transporter ATP-binding protein n=1 Tax=Streptomyces siamensis TaxID=1274986 RepID=A0ABP9J8D2_9ACTN
MTDTAMEAASLGKRFGRRDIWALRGCTFRLPTGRVCAVVGPNGAGKSTLLAIAAGLAAPTEGTIEMLGTPPASARPRVGFVGQDKPLYPQLTIAEMLRLGADLNPGHWDTRTAERIVADGALDTKARIRTLSGGQRTRVALAIAIAKQPELLLLDEPMADLDPMARHEVMGTLMAQAAEYGTTIVMSSHVMADLDGSCDHLLLVSNGSVRLAGDIDELRDAYAVVTGPAESGDGLAPHAVVESRIAGRQLTALVRTAGRPLPERWHADRPSLEELVLAHLRASQTTASISAPAKIEDNAA